MTDDGFHVHVSMGRGEVMLEGVTDQLVCAYSRVATDVTSTVALSSKNNQEEVESIMYTQNERHRGLSQ